MAGGPVAYVEVDMILASFFRAGRPRTKGSMRAWCTKGRTHKIHMEEETKDSSLWLAQMAKAAQVDHLSRFPELQNWGGPVLVVCTFVFERQAIPSHQTPYPTDIHLGDLDKLQRNLGDALERAHVIENDRLIVAWGTRKIWAKVNMVPGVQVEVTAIEVPAHV